MEDFTRDSQHKVDEVTGLEALRLAARLQSERGRRITVQELHRTAAEAGIDPDHLASALSTMCTDAPSTHMNRLRALFGLALFGAVLLAGVIVCLMAFPSPAPAFAFLTAAAASAISYAVVARAREQRSGGRPPNRLAD